MMAFTVAEHVSSELGRTLDPIAGPRPCESTDRPHAERVVRSPAAELSRQDPWTRAHGGPAAGSARSDPPDTEPDTAADPSAAPVDNPSG